MRKWGALRKAVLESWLAVFVLALSGMSASGEPVDSARAVLAAKGWYELRFRDAQEVKIGDGKPLAVLAADAARPIVVGGRTIAYAFDLPEGGCIAIAADDRLAPVFYYSLRGRLMVPGVPPAQAIMEAFADKIVQLQDDRHRETSTAHPLWASLAGLSDGERPVATLAEFPLARKGPLLTTTWNQDAPYNAQCPTPCPVGCVATAMAQVMRYWQHPVRGTGTHSYYWSPDEPYWSPDGRVLSADFGSTTYDWANMPDEATSASPPAVKNAVSTLCYHCGVAVDMQYGPAGSGAMEYPYIALRRYFGYENPHYAGRPDATRDEWYAMMCEQIDKGQPVLYCTRLHAFVLDGYDSPDLVHFNFGWGGQEDGWYPIDAPDGGSTQDLGDPCFVDAIIDIRPHQPGTFSVFDSRRDPADGGIVISWTSQVGKTYQVYYTEDLGSAAVWNPLVPAMPGTGSVMSTKDTGETGRAAPAGDSVKRRFYRVEEK
jgi:hypothetical protein